MGFTKEAEIAGLTAVSGLVAVRVLISYHRYLPDWSITLLLGCGFAVLSVTSLAWVAGVWQECASPATLAGGSSRYHPKLQHRMQANPGWEWISWLAGILLRSGIYLTVLILVGFQTTLAMPANWGVVGALFCFSLAATLAGIVSVALPRWLIGILGSLWARLEPPDLPSESSLLEGIGIAQPELSVWARPLRYLPGALISALLTVGAYASTTDSILGFQRACWGLALLAIVGYPIYVRSHYLSRKV